ncbi:hypothetical protein NWT39_09710 [Nitrososphaera viennensis]|uniref:Uncharacterized protein n=3 Tax=Nitrososphaera viennensis TaxID=1034015 RepID=A0A060HI13_9ARCH|nr:hypothetical protein [Nitrososphaera viennensis]AIC16234.1 hypothetical protein NVIE_019730 [Nitrososphaera viennensis EN76]UVS68174.1 hypothetical protein NWT39_09710 [Nitrososphaera viennensis]
MADMRSMPLKEFQRRLAKLLGTITADSIVRMLESNGVVKDDKVDINRLQGSLESLFQDAGILLINEIVKEPYVTQDKAGNNR